MDGANPNEVAIAEGQHCDGCPLAGAPYVAGDGYADCPVLVVGTAPGAVEETTGIAFTGPTGRIVRDVMDAMGVGESVYFTNVLKRRPTTDDGEQRQPSRRECWKCGSHLIHELLRNQPALVLALGATPLAFFAGRRRSVTSIHGLPFPVERFGVRFRLIATYDPAYVQRKGGLHSATGNEWLADVEELANQMRKEGL